MEALRSIQWQDWPALIEWATAEGCLPDDYGADDPHEYEWKGDHHDDARYTAPMRQALTTAVLRRVIPMLAALDPEPEMEPERKEQP